MMYNFAQQRQYLITWLRSQGIYDPRVLSAFAGTPREHFIDESLYKMAYADRALPTRFGQTISQPFMVAAMTQALRLTGSERVLEIGTGSGYQSAILSLLAAYVYSIERYEQLALQAASSLTQLGCLNVSIYAADGSLGWPAAAPYDRILVTAAAPEVPPHLLTQLAIGGILVIPVGSRERQNLQVIQRNEEGTQVQSLGSCVFVPLVGEEGWQQ